MTANFTVHEILDITQGRLASGLLPDSSGSICTDTRQLKPGDWYLALSGENFDGHDFLGDAFAAGAAGCIVAERPAYAIATTSFPIISVLDTLQAYHDLANYWRKQINPKVVAITGSSGKTTTKEMCAAIFNASLRTHKSNANENNEIGLPKTILSMPKDTQALILEMAMRGSGEITLLARTALPDIGIIVNVGEAHLERLSSLENIIRAKCELLEYLDQEHGCAIIGRPTNDLMSRVKELYAGKTICYAENDITQLSVTTNATKFKIGHGDNSQIFELMAHGTAQLQDAWCAITAAHQARLNEQTIAIGLSKYRPLSGRGKRLVGPNNSLIVDESYNANPDSVRSSINTFVDQQAFPFSSKYLILGGLAELGPSSADLHRELGAWLKDKDLTGLITVGMSARNIADGASGAKFETIACQDQAEAEKFLRPHLTHDSCVLIKGSHSAQLDQLVSRLVSSE